MISPHLCSSECETSLGMVFLMLQVLFILLVYGYFIVRMYLDDKRRQRLDRIREQQLQEYLNSKL